MIFRCCDSMHRIQGAPPEAIWELLKEARWGYHTLCIDCVYRLPYRQCHKIIISRWTRQFATPKKRKCHLRIIYAALCATMASRPCSEYAMPTVTWLMHSAFFSLMPSLLDAASALPVPRNFLFFTKMMILLDILHSKAYFSRGRRFAFCFRRYESPRVTICCSSRFFVDDIIICLLPRQRGWLFSMRLMGLRCYWACLYFTYHIITPSC